MTLCKLTTKDDMTHGGMGWGPGVAHTVKGKPALCSPTVLHAYRSPLLAVLMDPGQAEFGPSAHLWEAEGEVVIDDGAKVGCQTLTTVRRIDLPVVTTAQRVRFAILAAKAVCHDPTWTAWADGWLSGKDRSATFAAANAVEIDATAYATHAAHAATHAATAALDADAALVAVNAAYAAFAAACPADPAKVDLVALAEQAVSEETT
jgi:hypothetical protein